jgi:drug/metabolite transporter (DMT)-like permease
VKRLRSGAWDSAYVLLTFTALFWAGNSIVGRAARDFVPPLALSFWRWFLAFLLLLPLALPQLRKDWPVLKRQWPILVVLGTCGIGAFNSLLYSGLNYTTALNGMLLQAAQPALILGAGALLFGDPASRMQLGGALLSLLGVLTIVAKGSAGALLALRLNLGDMLILAAILLWTLYSVLLRKKPATHPLSFLAATLAVGIVMILPLYLVELAQGRRIVSAPESWGAIAYVAVFPSLIAYLFFTRGVELIGSARAGQFLNIMPAFGAILSVLPLGEQFRLYHLVGIALIGGGIILAERRRKDVPAGAGPHIG